jgi:hypothetical protein
LVKNKIALSKRVSFGVEGRAEATLQTLEALVFESIARQNLGIPFTLNSIFNVFNFIPLAVNKMTEQSYFRFAYPRA